MRRTSPLRWNAMLLLASVFTTGAVCAQVEQAAEPQSAKSVLLLESGQLLEGRVSQDGDRYIVTFPYGHVRVPANQVKRHCASRKDAYRRLHADLGETPTLDAHLRLAQWCLRQRLLAEADAELTRAERLAAPDDPRVVEARRRLKVAVNSMTISRTNWAPSGEAPTARPPAAAPRSRRPRPTPQTNVSPEQMRLFATHVQPLLLNGCAAVGCHGGRRQEFNIYRPLVRTIGRDLTDRNLQSVLSQVDRAAPESSPLLQHLATAHGGQKAPWLEESDPRLQLIARWVVQVAAPAKLPRQSWQNPPRRLQPAPRGTPSTAAEPSSSAAQPPQPPPRGFPPQGRQEAPPQTNPLDPAAFNRRFHPTRKP